MPSGFWWVFASYSVVWLALILYVVRLFARQTTLEREVTRLEDERGGAL